MRVAVPGALVCIALACRSTRLAAPVASLDGVQLLFRVEYAASDGSGGGSGRLTLRSWDDSHFLLDLRDPFGRGVWELRVAGDEAWIIDLQQRRYCSLDAHRSLWRTAWAGLSPRRVPRILLGLSPLASDGRGGEAVGNEARQTTTDEGQWRLTWHQGRLERWSLWRQGRAVLWWQREPMGGALSGASGGQLRWRLKVAEALDESAPARPGAPTLPEVSCEQLALP